MVNRLSADEIHHLQTYRLTSSLLTKFNVVDLLNEEFLKEFIRNLAQSLGAPSEKVAASIFIKRYAFLAVLSLYSMSVWNKRIDVSLENIEMESAECGKDWLPLFSFKELTAENWQGENRNEWRKSVITALFAKNIYPLIDQLEKIIKIPKSILWENIAVYLFWLYETELKEIGRDDFHFLLFKAEGELFGAFNQNPLQKYFSEKVYLEEFQAEIRIRETCCFSYQLPAGKRCKTCPCRQMVKDGRCINGESSCGSVRSLT
jgi:siderophore-iron reductase FhuF